MSAPLDMTDLGCEDFRHVQRLQRRMVAERRQGSRPDALLLCSHCPVVTAGRSTTYDELALARKTLRPHGIPLCRCERGGRLTYHGPGQVVAYPILALGGAERDLHAYLHGLEEAIIATLGDLGVLGERRPGQIGVWVGEAKIASIGVAVRGWVTWHGLALNLAGDLENFDLISLCGIPNPRVTSVAEQTGRRVPREKVQDRLAEHVCHQFNREGTWRTPEEVNSAIGSASGR